MVILPVSRLGQQRVGAQDVDNVILEGLIPLVRLDTNPDTFYQTLGVSNGPDHVGEAACASTSPTWSGLDSLVLAQLSATV